LPTRFTRLPAVFAACALALTAACSDSTGAAHPAADIGPIPALSAPLDSVTTPTGLKYYTLAEGTGSAAVAGDRVSVHYTGWLSTGQGFDTSRGGTPISFTLGQRQVIAGFDEGVTGMKVGGRRRLIVPPGLGYGANPVMDRSTGTVVIPANSTLVFDVELVSLTH